MEESRLGTTMTDFGIDFRRSDDFPHLRDRVAAARAQFRANADQYVQLRRKAEAMRKEAQELRDHATELRDSLRDSGEAVRWAVDAYYAA